MAENFNSAIDVCSANERSIKMFCLHSFVSLIVFAPRAWKSLREQQVFHIQSSTRAWPHWLQFLSRPSLVRLIHLFLIRRDVCFGWNELNVHEKQFFATESIAVQLRYNYPTVEHLCKSNWIKINGANIEKLQAAKSSVRVCPSSAECGWQKKELRVPLIFIKIFYESRLWIYNATQNNRYLKANADLINSSEAISAFCRAICKMRISRVES